MAQRKKKKNRVKETGSGSGQERHRKKGMCNETRTEKDRKTEDTEGRS